MMNTRRACLQALLISAVLAAPLALAVEKGKPAPTFELPGRAEPIKLNDYRGKFVYLDFWASWCGPCKQSFPWMNELQSKFGGKGLRVIGVNVDTKPEDAQKFLSQIKANFTIAFDHAGATPRSFGIKGMPTSVLIGPDGNVVFEHAGFKDDDKAEIEDRIKQLLKDK